MNSPRMNPRVATTAKGNQVVQRIVPQWALGGRSLSVNMVNVQMVLCAAILASVIVSLQGFAAIAAEAIVILGSLGVFSHLITICIQPFADFANLFSLLAFGASLLWTGAVFKIIAAFRAKQDRANFDSAFLSAHFTKGLGVFIGAVSRHTSLASALVASSRLVGIAANNAIALLKAASGLAVGSKGARFASLHIGGRSDNLLRAIGASYRSVVLHFSTPTKFFHNIAGSCDNG
jgi:ABC-type multidrug transport system fused ATPase/permease subunit